MDIKRRLLSMLGRVTADPAGNVLEIPEPVALPNIKQEMGLRGRIKHYALKIGAWRVGQIIELEHSCRKYRVHNDGSWRRQYPYSVNNGRLLVCEMSRVDRRKLRLAA